MSNSERSNECIDFTMMCVFFFVSVYSITNQNNAPISNFGGSFPMKSEYSWCIIEVKIQIFTKSVKNSKICMIKNSTLSFSLVFLQVSIEKTRSIIIGKILSTISRKHLKNSPCRFNFFGPIKILENLVQSSS
ncbi:Uncharacterized protein FWK35_00033539 [Aphis craccivora]|uniref:Uncharacterized protein n=1 Tax=Aphis craccivora TaxID=307492 RepID=A0A6G0XI82_APHCR|nr:Uncharacterized protein FWK35_00033539 [Aphis craccivora]